ncbi:MAG: hypothetical protein WCW01_04265 [Gammaproteobacteria bacterium]|jgi:arsenate reductase-like glutaredoxin family protein
MKTKSFQDYLEKRLSKKEIKKIEEEAKLEKDALLSSGHKPMPNLLRNMQVSLKN